MNEKSRMTYSESQSASSGQFGITISCYRGDLPLLKGCLESIRSNLPVEIPICLIQHGEMRLGDLERTYGIRVLHEREVDSRLREASYGYGLTKMIAFWHSPFEHFLHIDADAVCWGNIVKGLPWREFDFIYNEPHEIIDDRIQRGQYFDPSIVFGPLPKFPWEGQPYFNSGIFAAKRGILDLEEYLQLCKFQRENPTAFNSGEQGILNYMIFRRITSGTIKACQWPLQAVVPVIPKEVLKGRFRFENGRPAICEEDRRLVHWAGPKPYLTKSGPFPEPMSYYRTQYLVRTGSPWRRLAIAALIIDELWVRLGNAHRVGLLSSIIAKLRNIASRRSSRLQTPAITR